MPLDHVSVISDVNLRSPRAAPPAYVPIILKTTGLPPLGWYTGRYSANTQRLVMEETETIYDSDAYKTCVSLPHPPSQKRVSGRSPKQVVLQGIFVGEDQTTTYICRDVDPSKAVTHGLGEGAATLGVVACVETWEARAGS